MHKFDVEISPKLTALKLFSFFSKSQQHQVFFNIKNINMQCEAIEDWLLAGVPGLEKPGIYKLKVTADNTGLLCSSLLPGSYIQHRRGVGIGPEDT